MKITFITGNDKKAQFLEKFLGFKVNHKKIELEEIQSLSLREITEHKARQAYSQIKSPVLVEDVALSLNSLGKLPGPFIKWFLEEIGTDGVCKLASALGERSAVAEICYAYFNGAEVHFFEGKVDGQISDRPRGKDGWGWNPVFIPEGAVKTYSEMDDEETAKYSLRMTTVYPEIKEFLMALDFKKA